MKRYKSRMEGRAMFSDPKQKSSRLFIQRLPKDEIIAFGALLPDRIRYFAAFEGPRTMNARTLARKVLERRKRFK